VETTQKITDKVSISLSLQCAVHYWMLLAVIPTSIYALTMGCKRHKHFRLLIMGSTGLALLVLTVMLGEEITGESGEKILAVIGSSLVAAGYFWNFRLYRHLDCACPDHH
jgi:hypothetical protein